MGCDGLLGPERLGGLSNERERGIQHKPLVSRITPTPTLASLLRAFLWSCQDSRGVRRPSHKLRKTSPEV